MSWAQENAQGKLDNTFHAKDVDLSQLYVELNRRRNMYHQADVTHTLPPFIRAEEIIAFQEQIEAFFEYPLDSTPWKWIWPIADSDEDKEMVLHSSSDPNKVGLLEKIGNEYYDWKRSPTANTWIFAEDINELRLACERLYRIRDNSPKTSFGTIRENRPDLAYSDSLIRGANSLDEETRAFHAWYGMNRDPAGKGLTSSCTVLATTFLEVYAARACDVDVYFIPEEIPFDGSYPTWNNLDASTTWTGGLGLGTAQYLGEFAFPTVSSPLQISNQALLDALQQVADDNDTFTLLYIAVDADLPSARVSASLNLEYELTDVVA
jgi:hypothetical protein